MKADVDRCVRAGFRAHFLKPTSIETVCAEIERARVARTLTEPQPIDATRN